MFQYFLCLLGLVTLTNGYAQSFNFDVPEEKKPYYEDVYKYDAEHVKGIKTQVQIKTTHSPSSTTMDTIKIFDYNKEGQILRKVFFEDNVRTGVKHFTYKNGLLHYTHYSTPKNNGRTFHYSYDTNGNNIELLESNFRGENFTSFKLKKMDYDANNNLIKKELFSSQSKTYLKKSLNQKAEFEYDHLNRLIKHIHTMPNAVFQPVSEYLYSNHLDRINRYYDNKKDTTYKLYDYCAYKHNEKGQLIYKETLSKVGKPGEVGLNAPRNIHKYTYNEDGKLIHATYYFGENIYTEANYTYKDGQIQELIAYNHNPSKSSHIYFFYPSSTYEGKRVFKRDSKGFLIEEQTFKDGRLVKVTSYKNTYYD